MQNGSSFWMPLQLLLIKWVSKTFSVQTKYRNHQLTLYHYLPSPLLQVMIGLFKLIYVKMCTVLSRQRKAFAIKRAFFVKKVLCDIKYSRRDIFQESVLNDNFHVNGNKTVLWDWEIFSGLLWKSNSGNIFLRKSKVNEKLDLVDMETKNLADLLYIITDIKVNNSMNPSVLS